MTSFEQEAPAFTRGRLHTLRFDRWRFQWLPENPRDRLNAQAAADREAEEKKARQEQEKARARRQERKRREAAQKNTEEGER